MKKIFMGIIALATSIASMQAEKLFIENFDYSTYTMPDSLGVVNGWNYYTDAMLGQWTESGFVASDSLVDEPGLVYNGFTGAFSRFNIPSTGHVCRITSPAAGFQKKMTPTTADVVYAAMLVKVHKAPANGATFFALSASDVSDWLQNVARVAVKWDAATQKLAFGISEREYLTSSSFINYSPYSYDLDSTYMLCVQYSRSTRTATLYMNPTKTTTLGTQIAQYQTTRDLADRPIVEQLEYVWLYGGKTSMPSDNDKFSLTVDAIRVATTNINNLFDTTAVATVPEIFLPHAINYGGLEENGTYEQKFLLKGSNLNGDVELSCDNSAFTFSTSTVSKAAAELGDTITLTLNATNLIGSEISYAANITAQSAGAISQQINVHWTDNAYTLYTAANLAELKSNMAAAASESHIRNVLITGTINVTEIPLDTTYTAWKVIDNSQADTSIFYYISPCVEAGMLATAGVGSTLTNLKVQIIGERGASIFTPMCISKPSPDLVIGGNTAVKQLSATSFRLYPTMATETLHLELGEGTLTQCILYTLQGKCISTYPLHNSSATISVNELPQGTYIVQATNQNGDIFRQIFMKK